MKPDPLLFSKTGVYALIVLAVVLAAVLTLLVNRVEIRVDPKRRTPEDIMKWDKEERN